MQCRLLKKSHFRTEKSSIHTIWRPDLEEVNNFVKNNRNGNNKDKFDGIGHQSKHTGH